MKAADFRAQAREALKGNWVLSIIVTLVAILLGAGAGTGNWGFPAGGGGSEDSAELVMDTLQLSPFIIGIVLTVLSVLAIYVIIVIVIGGAAKLGLVTYNLDLITKRKPPAFSTLFSRFSLFPKAFMLQLLMSIYVILWLLLLIIPGIIASYRYAMAPYILAENPEISANEAITRSKKMMKGNKWRLFCLEFSFIGWHFLCMFTLGIGYLWLNPYIGVSMASFYLDVSDGAAIEAEYVEVEELEERLQ